MHINRDRRGRLLKVSQPLYAKKILEKVRIKEVKTYKVPIDSDINKVLVKSQNQASANIIIRYQSEIKLMMYIMT